MDQFSLFGQTLSEPNRSSDHTEIIQRPGLDILYIRNWIDPATGDQWFQELKDQLIWEQSHILMYGKRVAIPRLNAWYGDQGCEYRYSNYQLKRNDWTETLLKIKAHCQHTLVDHDIDSSINGLLANLYRDGNDSVAYHSDDELELGSNPVITSVSLGEGRRFVLKPKKQNGEPNVSIELSHGSLLIMKGSTQHHWQHALPKTRSMKGPRINLTFRQII